MGKAIKAKVARRPRKAKKDKARVRVPAKVSYEVWAVRPERGGWAFEDAFDLARDAFEQKDAMEAVGAKAVVIRIDLPAVGGD